MTTFCALHMPLDKLQIPVIFNMDRPPQEEERELSSTYGLITQSLTDLSVYLAFRIIISGLVDENGLARKRSGDALRERR